MPGMKMRLLMGSKCFDAGHQGLVSVQCLLWGLDDEERWQ